MKIKTLLLTLALLCAGAFGQSVVVGAGGVSATSSNNFTVPQTISGNAAASTPSLAITGTPFTSGTATTNVPELYVNSGTAPSTWSTSGTLFGVNGPSGFNGNLLDFHLNGGTSVFSVSKAGSVTLAGNLNAGSGQAFLGGIVRTITTGSGTSYTVTGSEGYIFLTNTAARTVTLLQAPSQVGTIVCIKDAAGTASTGNITISVATSGTIDGAASKVINTNYGISCVMYQSATGVYLTVQ